MSLTREQKEFIKDSYRDDPTPENIAFLQNKFDCSKRSITATLTAAGLYKKPAYRTKTGELPVNKFTLVNFIADAMGVNADELDGLENAPKMVLKMLLRRLSPNADALLSGK